MSVVESGVVDGIGLAENETMKMSKRVYSWR